MINPDKLAPTPQHGAIRPTGALSRTLAYILPVALSILTLLIRLLLGLRFYAPPILGLFTFPIMISAYLGGVAGQ